MSGMGRQPSFEPLGGRHAAVHGDHHLRAKPRLHPRFELGGQVDLGHHQQGLRLGLVSEHVFHGLQVHLSFAAARAAEQQKWPALLRHLLQHLLLLF